MTIIIYGKNKEIFETDKVSIPHAIIALYEYCGGSMDNVLFSKIIEGMIDNSTIAEMVAVFEHMSFESQIAKIYAYADCYFTMEAEECLELKADTTVTSIPCMR